MSIRSLLLSAALASILAACGGEPSEPPPPRKGVHWDASAGVLAINRSGMAATVEFVWIEPGEFTMGSADNRHTVMIEGPPRRQRIGRGFWLARHELTRAQWRAMGGAIPRSAPDLPVTRVSWHEVQSLLRTLNEQTKGRFRLPAETEWEYACRAGSDALWGHGADKRDLSRFAWYRGNSSQVLHPVAQKHPNDWGLFDMHGNAVEWTSGEASPANRVLRGGMVLSDAEGASCACRYQYPAAYGYQYAGVRLAAD